MSMCVWNRRQILREILEEKARHKRQAEADALAKREEIASKAPVYAGLERELALIRMELSRQALAHPEQVNSGELDEEAKRRVYALRDRARAELERAGYTLEDLKPKYLCPLCQDTGSVSEGPGGRCRCVQQELHRRIYALTGANGQSFESFDLSLFPDEASETGPSQRRRMEQAREYGQLYAGRFPQNEKPNLLLLGPAGLGKTFLLNCISLAVLERDFTVLRLSAFQMFELMRKYHRGQDEGGMETMLQAQLLALDDLGTEPMMQNITREYLFTLLSERKNRRLGTLMASNLDADGLLQRYGERVLSRLMDKSDTVTIHFTGKDLRRGGR